MKRALAIVAVAVLLLGGGAAAASVQAVDDAGVTTRLPAPARRIVSLAPHLTELLFSAGAGDRVVGAVEYSDFPPAARRIPRVGDAAQLDLERIVALRPDLVVVWLHGNSPQQIGRLRGLGLAVYASESRRFAAIPDNLRRLGRLAGTDAEADAAAVEFEREIAALRARYAGRAPLRVFYQIWHRPLLTVNGQHLISEALALCGARNVFAELGALTPTVSEEAVLGADPDAIVAGSVEPGAADPFDGWRRLGGLRAARQGHLVVADADRLHRQSVRIAAGTRELCERLDRVRAALPR